MWQRSRSFSACYITRLIKLPCSNSADGFVADAWTRTRSCSFSLQLSWFYSVRKGKGCLRVTVHVDNIAAQGRKTVRVRVRDHQGRKQERDEWDFKCCVERHCRIFHQKGGGILQAASAEWSFAGLLRRSRLQGWPSQSCCFPALKMIPAHVWVPMQQIAFNWWWVHFPQFAFTGHIAIAQELKRSSTDESSWVLLVLPVTESWNLQCWKTPPRPSSPSVLLQPIFPH